ncbi:hypothetical protein CLF_104268 [Clonorchis sinensis]|uniref:Uncharacterized protein n=1 Tax=Clonorchis sinensis TaxID=79923 RepID=G7YBA1_CLOSI|nr:hypothetical protein CLF_104268 [Clonorchis sinensis]
MGGDTPRVRKNSQPQYTEGTSVKSCAPDFRRLQGGLKFTCLNNVWSPAQIKHGEDMARFSGPESTFH